MTEFATEAQIEAAAKAICRKQGHEPDTLHQAMPGDDWDKWPEDSHFFNSRGERCKLILAWRKYIGLAVAALDAAAAVQRS